MLAISANPAAFGFDLGGAAAAQILGGGFAYARGAKQSIGDLGGCLSPRDGSEIGNGGAAKERDPVVAHSLDRGDRIVEVSAKVLI